MRMHAYGTFYCVSLCPVLKACLFTTLALSSPYVGHQGTSTVHLLRHFHSRIMCLFLGCVYILARVFAYVSTRPTFEQCRDVFKIDIRAMLLDWFLSLRNKLLHSTVIVLHGTYFLHHIPSLGFD